jgi:hypothetical protein
MTKNSHQNMYICIFFGPIYQNGHQIVTTSSLLLALETGISYPHKTTCIHLQLDSNGILYILFFRLKMDTLMVPGANPWQSYPAHPQLVQIRMLFWFFSWGDVRLKLHNGGGRVSNVCNIYNVFRFRGTFSAFSN